jgi:hypothetical protein
MLIAPCPALTVLTERATAVECDKEPLVAVMVSVDTPMAEVVSTVRVALPGAPIVLEEKDAVAPVGRPLTPKLT